MWLHTSRQIRWDSIVFAHGNHAGFDVVRGVQLGKITAVYTSGACIRWVLHFPLNASGRTSRCGPHYITFQKMWKKCQDLQGLPG